MSGHVGDLSPKQAATLEEFKRNLKDVMQPHFTDYYLLRWLRARGFDLKKSEKMLRDSLAWRQRNKVDTILEDYEPPEVIRKYFPGGMTGGVDKEGSPIWVDIPGYMDVKGMLYSAKKADLVKNKVWTAEMIFRLFKELSKKQNKNIQGLVLIFDMAKFGLHHLWKPAVDVYSAILSMFEANYPESLKICYIVNAPVIFPVAYNLIKPFLSEDTKKKLHVLGANYKERLLQDIDADQLPVHWGGTMADPDGDPYCKSKVVLGGDIPKSYYLNHNYVDMSTFTTATVGRGSSLQLEYEIQQRGSIIRWQFHTEGNDIGFGLFRRTSDERQKASEMEAVVDSQRVNSHMVPEDGMVTCDRPGTYIVRFDNTYSWVNSKNVSYLIEVLEDQDISDIDAGCINTAL